MRAYTVHIKDGSAETAILLQEGFSWGAFFFTALWAAWHRMWWAALALAVLFTATGWLLAGTGGAVSFIVHAGLGAVVGIGANEFRRAHLARLGWREAASLAAQNAEEAEIRYFAATGPAAGDAAGDVAGDVA